jgi:hypothetical protein
MNEMDRGSFVPLLRSLLAIYKCIPSMKREQTANFICSQTSPAVALKKCTSGGQQQKHRSCRGFLGKRKLWRMFAEELVREERKKERKLKLVQL